MAGRKGKMKKRRKEETKLRKFLWRPSGKIMLACL